LRYFASTLIAFALLLAAGCSTFLLDAGTSLVGVHGASTYNPQAPTIHISSLDVALASAPWISAGGFQVTALDGLNKPDSAALGTLKLNPTSNTLTISATRPLSSVAIYVRYDSSKLHPTQLGSPVRADGIALNARVKPGLLAVGVAAIGDGVLSTRIPLASLSFAPGADSQVRIVSIKGIPNNIVPDLVAVDNVTTPGSATLSWSERHVGDYDQNSEVNAADLSKLGKYLGETPAAPDWNEAQLPDGDFNGEVNVADITPIGANLGSRITGFNVYRTPLTSPSEDPDPVDSGRWTKVDNTGDPSGPSAPRQFNNQKTRLTYTFIDSCGIGDFGWYVAAVADTGETPALGPPRVVAKQTVTPAGPPPAGLSFEIIAPATEFQTVGDEFYLAVKVTGVTNLFSANVRFEYDGSVVQYEDGVASYNDGTDHPNFLVDPLFVAVDNVDTATSPFVLLGFNDTEKQGTATQSGDGYLGYFKFKAIAPGIINEAFRFPQSSNFIYLWDATYGEAAAAPALGGPQLLNIAP